LKGKEAEYYGYLGSRGLYGKITDIKNQISETLYIFDEPDRYMEKRTIEQVEHGNLNATFDLKNQV